MLVAMMVVGLAACTDDEAPAANEPPLDATVMAMDPTLVDPWQVDFPLDPYTGEKDAGFDVIGQAVDALQQECFRRFGLDLPLPDQGGGRVFQYPSWDWYGLWDEETAGVHGYRSPPVGGGERFAETVPREWHPVLGGTVETFNGEEVPEGGCQGESFRVLDIDMQGSRVDVQGLQQEAVNRARQHSEVEALVDDWSGCVASAGWGEFADPSEPFRRWQGTATGDSPAPPTEEVEMALADIGCKRESGLLRAWVAAEVAYQGILAEENTEGLRELKEWRDEAQRKANDIVAGGA